MLAVLFLQNIRYIFLVFVSPRTKTFFFTESCFKGPKIIIFSIFKIDAMKIFKCIIDLWGVFWVKLIVNSHEWDFPSHPIKKTRSFISPIGRIYQTSLCGYIDAPEYMKISNVSSFFYQCNKKWRSKNLQLSKFHYIITRKLCGRGKILRQHRI